MPKKHKEKKAVFKPTLLLVISNFFEHDVGKNAAALAYYFMFALFPLLIFISNLLGLLDLNVTAITQSLQQFLPKTIVELVETYLDYVSHTSSRSLLWFSLVFSIFFPMRAAGGLMDNVRQAYRLGKPSNSLAYRIRQLIYTVVFVIVIGLTLIISTLGKHVISYIYGFLPERALQLSEYFLSIWHYLRFIPIGILMLLALGTLYAASLDKRPSIKALLPGIVLALTFWLLISVGFSFYVENFANYSLIYGTLGAVIVLLIWLYISAVILILGAELNAALQIVKSS